MCSRLVVGSVMSAVIIKIIVKMKSELIMTLTVVFKPSSTLKILEFGQQCLLISDWFSVVHEGQKSFSVLVWLW